MRVRPSEAKPSRGAVEAPRSNRRGRAIFFAIAAAVCAGLAASAVGGAGSSVDAQLGELRRVLVTSVALPARRPISARALAESVTVRRVPARFLPPDALAAPPQLLGRAPATEIPAGSYVLASQLRSGAAPPAAPDRLDPGRRPVEITVTGAGALAEGADSGIRVDVVVTTERGTIGGAGRTYVAARAVQLLHLRPAGEGGTDTLPGPALAAWTATLALTRAQALRLIHAETFARSVRLIET